MTTCAPGTTAPVESVTVPTSVPVTDWACNAPTIEQRRTNFDNRLSKRRLAGIERRVGVTAESGEVLGLSTGMETVEKPFISLFLQRQIVMQ